MPDTLETWIYSQEERTRENGVRYGAEASHNHRPDWLVFVNGFAMNRLTTWWYFHM